MNISWESPEDDGGSPIAGYRIYRKSPDGEWTFLVSVWAWETHYIDSIIGTREYYYYVVAFNDIGSSVKSQVVKAQLFGVPPPPSSLSFKIEGDSINISWKSSPENGFLIKEYRIYRGMRPGHGSYIGSTENTYFVDRNVSRGGIYYYYVKAVNEVGEGEKSEEIEVSLKNEGDPVIYGAIAVSSLFFLFLLKKKGLLF